MSVPREPTPVHLLVSVLHRPDPAVVARAVTALSHRFGPVAMESEPTPFAWTDYYQPEMGQGLERFFLGFARPVARESLVAAKLACYEVEAGLTAADGGRTVNLDPGLLAPEHLVLATGKPHAHRIYLGQGVYGDLTLIYQRGEYHPLPWTYPDYASAPVREMLAQWRRWWYPRSGRGQRRKKRLGKG